MEAININPIIGLQSDLRGS